MDVPGEKLLIKLWESLADNGIGSLLKPWQMRREARAQLELRRNEMLLLAQAEKEVEEIRAGRKKVESQGKSIMLISSDTEVIDGKAEPVLDVSALLDAADKANKADALREEVNVAKTVLQAEELLRNDTDEPSETPIEADWLYRWRDCASQVSSDELQSLWAKVLAGEAKVPGAYSLRTLDFLKNLSKSEAQQIQQLCPYVVNGQIIPTYGAMAPDATASLDFLLLMQELGLISGVGGTGLSITWRHNGVGSMFMQLLLLQHQGVIARSSEISKPLVLSMYRVTPLGAQVFALNPMPAPAEYVQAIANACKAQGFNVSTALCLPVSGQPGHVHILNEVAA